jgi:cyanate lyase
MAGDAGAGLPTRHAGRAEQAELTALLLAAKEERRLTFAELGERVGRSEVWVATAIYGQATMSGDEVGALARALGLEPSVCRPLTAVPTRGTLEAAVPVDPLLYRFYEIIQVFGPALKAVIHEKFGDGIMSAIDFRLSIDRKPDPAGDRVIVTLDGKFLPYRKW